MYVKCEHLGEISRISLPLWFVCRTASQVSTNCQIFPIVSVLYGKVNKVQNLLEKFDKFGIGQRTVDCM
jgi:hypothetical protein